MSWYKTIRECTALRKHKMRVDLRMYCGESSDFTNPNELQSSIKSIITTGIMKGLDVVGIISNIGPQIGWEALKLSKTQNMDIYIIPGEDYQCSDKAHLYIYLLKDSMPPGLAAEQAIKYARDNRGFVMMAKITHRQAQWLDRVKGQPIAPQAVELYADDYQGYTDSHLDESYRCFINSGARSSNDLDKSTSFTMVDREDLEGIGLLPEDEGEEYTPNYIKNVPELAGVSQQPIQNTPVF